MSAKELIFEDAARAKLREGIDQLADLACVTLGPEGRNVGLDVSWGTPKITNDGHTIVKDITLKDQYANMGASMAKEVASTMKEKCGDGTTTAIILLRALVQNGVKNIAAGSSPISLKRGIDKAVSAIVKELDKLAVCLNDDKERLSIATVSASGDKAIGKCIADCLKKVGKTGVVAIEEGKTTETSIEMVEGMQFDRGYLSPYFCTHAEKMVVEMEDARILVTDKKISSVQELLPVLQAVAAAGQNLLIIADDIDGDALSTLVMNRLRGTLKVCAVKAPGFGDARKAQLEDLAVITGATFVTDETGTSLKDAGSEALGFVEKLVVSKEKTTLINGKGDSRAIQDRLKQIDAEIKRATSDWDKKKLQDRRAALSGGVAVIRVGAQTTPELEHKKQLFEDSLNATRAALEEGILPGGGVALVRASRTVLENGTFTKEEKVGAQMVCKACEAPLKQIVLNAGFDGALILEQVLTAPPAHGFNVIGEKVEDLIKAGVIDPAKVVKCALQIAASSAGMILLSEALIGNAPDS